MAAAFAARGFEIVGVDINQKSVDLVNEGKAPVQETDLDELIFANKTRIRATVSHEEAILNSDITFVIVPTPSDERGAFSLQYVEWAFTEIGKALVRKTGYHNVVLTSTVLPGSTREALLPVLEKASGKKVGRDIGLCYSPEFIALGSIIRNFLNPDFTLIGEFDEKCGKQLEQCYAEVVENQAPSVRMSLENAELTKISVNTFVTTKISFANMLADICEKLPGGDVDVVTEALGRDSRIGSKYLTGSIGYGGPCFPRDNVAFSFIAKQLGVDARLARASDSVNREIPAKFTDKILPLIRKGATVGVLGLAYKPFSHVTDESQGLNIAIDLGKRGFRVVAFDPMSGEMEVDRMRRHIIIFDSLEECLKQSEVVLITTPDPVFAGLEPPDFKNEWSEIIVIDFWRLLKDKLQNAPGIKYIAVGRGEDDAAGRAKLKDLWVGKSDAKQVKASNEG